MTFSSPSLIGFVLNFCSFATSHVFARVPTAQRSEQVFRPLPEPLSPGLSAIVLKEGKTVFEGCYGLAHLEIRTPISPLTNFRLASFTKQFTAMCIMFLVQDGKLSCDDTQIKDAQILAMMKQRTSTDSPPGSRWHYSNAGCAMLAMIVEKVSGKPFGEFLHERIVAPQGMKNTLAYERGKNEVPQRAFGLLNRDCGWIEADQSSTSAVLVAAFI